MEKQISKTKNIVKLIIIGVLFISLGSGMALAYLTDAKSEINTFVVGNVKIDLTEPHWDPNDNKNICPGKEISKDPTIENLGTGNLYAKMVVLIPYIEGLKTIDSTTQKVITEDTGLFEYTANPGWVKIDADSGLVTIDGVKYLRDSYQYNTVIKTNEKQTLFTSVKFKNIQDGQVSLNGKTFKVPVYAYAIQADGLSLNSADENYAWKAFDVQSNLNND